MSRASLIRVVLCTLVLPLGLAWAAEAPSRERLDVGDLRVMTFNIRYGTANDGENSWNRRKDLVCDVLRRHDPDVVGLQEALRFQIDDMRSALPGYAEIGVGRDDGMTGGEYAAILYREDRLDGNERGTFWLSDTPEVCGSITWGNACTRICTWARFTCNASGRTFYLFNTHLDHVSQYSRDRSVILLAERIRNRKHQDPVIVTGDFNAGEDNPAVLYVKGRGQLQAAKNSLAMNPIPLVDTFRVLYPDANDAGTFNGFEGNRSGAKIDYILAQPGIEVLHAAIVRDREKDRYPSDHFPVTAELAFAKTTSH